MNDGPSLFGRKRVRQPEPPLGAGGAALAPPLLVRSMPAAPGDFGPPFSSVRVAEEYLDAMEAAQAKGRRHLHWKTIARLQRMQEEDERRARPSPVPGVKGCARRAG